MATVHYENGKYHVHIEAINAAKKTDSPNNPANAGKTETAFSEHMIKQMEYTFQPVEMIATHHPIAAPHLSNRLSAGDYPPPKA